MLWWTVWLMPLEHATLDASGGSCSTICLCSWSADWVHWASVTPKRSWVVQAFVIIILVSQALDLKTERHSKIPRNKMSVYTLKLLLQGFYSATPWYTSNVLCYCSFLDYCTPSTLHFHYVYTFNRRFYPKRHKKRINRINIQATAQLKLTKSA